jgi:hypothetical protein
MGSVYRSTSSGGRVAVHLEFNALLSPLLDFASQLAAFNSSSLYTLVLGTSLARYTMVG